MFCSLASSPSLPSWGQACDGHAGPILTVIHRASRQPAVASSPDRLPSVPVTVHRILSGWQENRREEKTLFFFFEQSLCRWCRLYGWQHNVTCRKANQPLSPPLCHLLNAVTPAYKLIKCVTAAQPHTNAGTQRQENTRIVPSEHLAGLSDSSMHCVNTADRTEWQRCRFAQQCN